MSYTLVVGGELEFPLATLTGWSNFKKWAESLDGYRAITDFIENGQTSEMPELEVELKKALAADPPGDKTVASTARDLIKSLMKRGEDHESAFVSDGFSDNDDADGEWWDGETDDDN